MCCCNTCIVTVVYANAVCVSDEILRQSCAAVIHAINQQSPDVIQKHSSLVFPLIFFAMHQKSGTVYTYYYDWPLFDLHIIFQFVSALMLILGDYSLFIHLWHAPLWVCSAKRRRHSPEWMILSHVNCFIQGEVKWLQVLLGSLHPRSTGLGHPGGLLQFSKGEAVKICLASDSPVFMQFVFIESAV